MSNTNALIPVENVAREMIAARERADRRVNDARAQTVIVAREMSAALAHDADAHAAALRDAMMQMQARQEAINAALFEQIRLISSGNGGQRALPYNGGGNGNGGNNNGNGGAAASNCGGNDSLFQSMCQPPSTALLRVGAFTLLAVLIVWVFDLAIPFC